MATGIAHKRLAVYLEWNLKNPLSPKYQQGPSLSGPVIAIIIRVRETGFTDSPVHARSLCTPQPCIALATETAH